MITTSQKATILAKAGIDAPPFPQRSLPIEERFLMPGARVPQAQIDADVALSVAVECWNREVNNLFATYVAARAARSLREAEDADRLVRLRYANAGNPSTRRRHDAGIG